MFVKNIDAKYFTIILKNSCCFFSYRERTSKTYTISQKEVCTRLKMTHDSL